MASAAPPPLATVTVTFVAVAVARGITRHGGQRVAAIGRRRRVPADRIGLAVSSAPRFAPSN
jgi:hypothetical protein